MEIWPRQNMNSEKSNIKKNRKKKLHAHKLWGLLNQNEAGELHYSDRVMVLKVLVQFERKHVCISFTFFVIIHVF